jgi:ribose-phosphate pyrophosphokinase
MIQYRNIKNKDETTPWTLLTPTIFPDKTCQVWKLDENSFKFCRFEIKWNYECDSEFIQIAQLVDLFSNYCESYSNIYLYIPYFPYARQDKNISNNSTFGKTTFLILLKSLKIASITTYDIHSEMFQELNEILNIKPNHFLEVIKKEQPNVLFFPDKGALDRYINLFANDIEFQCRAKAYGEKVRNQSTGEITGYVIKDPGNVLFFSKVLVLDDLCDRGGTFILAAKHLKTLGVSSIDLCVSHGLWSGGEQLLHDGGIRKLFTTDSLIHNGESYETKEVFKI